MGKTLLAECDCFDEGKMRIYKTEDGKFFCEEIRRSAELDSEIDVVEHLILIKLHETFTSMKHILRTMRRRHSCVAPPFYI